MLWILEETRVRLPTLPQLLLFMNNATKILLTINLEGGILTRQDKPEIIMWSLNERDLDPNKDWRDGEGLKVVKSGSTKHYNLTSTECVQRIKLTKDAYDYFISDEAPSFIKKFNWITLKEKQRLGIHLNVISESLGGKSFTYEILND